MTPMCSLYTTGRFKVDWTSWAQMLQSLRRLVRLTRERPVNCYDNNSVRRERSSQGSVLIIARYYRSFTALASGSSQL